MSGGEITVCVCGRRVIYGQTCTCGRNLNSEPLTAEERLLLAIFGAPDNPDTDTTNEGDTHG